MTKQKRMIIKTIADKLKTIKILDPACGSGAFPMGLLNRMIEILCHITPDENIYEMKLAIIENCIYGSDIQSIAAQITKTSLLYFSYSAIVRKMPRSRTLVFLHCQILKQSLWQPIH